MDQQCKCYPSTAKERARWQVTAVYSRVLGENPSEGFYKLSFAWQQVIRGTVYRAIGPCKQVIATSQCLNKAHKGPIHN